VAIIAEFHLHSHSSSRIISNENDTPLVAISHTSVGIATEVWDIAEPS